MFVQTNVGDSLFLFLRMTYNSLAAAPCIFFCL